MQENSIVLFWIVVIMGSYGHPRWTFFPADIIFSKDQKKHYAALKEQTQKCGQFSFGFGKYWSHCQPQHTRINSIGLPPYSHQVSNFLVFEVCRKIQFLYKYCPVQIDFKLPQNSSHNQEWYHEGIAPFSLLQLVLVLIALTRERKKTSDAHLKLQS